MKLYTLILSLLPLCAHAANDSISARVETEATFSGGDYAPLWLSTNKYGMGSAESNSFYLRTGADWKKISVADGKSVQVLILQAEPVQCPNSGYSRHISMSLGACSD